ncbi:MAG: UDP-N-acetylmuramoyl-tripeptide--D-alanyl-D-alanine ligase, partial [Bacteroidaceae bacterium]|nr:UDP-N-acetylmuramoyl-tripeptide--D-alanyl-D-alanine ligase [Bacteroidaceae bacterium]
MEIKDLYKLFVQHPVITTDSRDVPKGSMFFALKGETFDGNAYAKAALAQGAALAIIDEQEYAE